MENSVVLLWKEFSIPTDRLMVVLKNLLSDNYDGLVCEPDQLHVVFHDEVTQEDLSALTTFWSQVTEVQFSPSLHEIISQKINGASAFGRALILDFAVDNVQLGVTQAGKTRAVSDYCRALQRYLESGSLYAAVEQINEMLTAGAPLELSPFVTAARLTSYRDRILGYLAL